MHRSVLVIQGHRVNQGIHQYRVLLGFQLVLFYQGHQEVPIIIIIIIYYYLLLLLLSYRWSTGSLRSCSSRGSSCSLLSRETIRSWWSCWSSGSWLTIVPLCSYISIRTLYISSCQCIGRYRGLTLGPSGPMLPTSPCGPSGP